MELHLPRIILEIAIALRQEQRYHWLEILRSDTLRYSLHKVFGTSNRPVTKQNH